MSGMADGRIDGNSVDAQRIYLAREDRIMLAIGEEENPNCTYADNSRSRTEPGAAWVEFCYRER